MDILISYERDLLTLLGEYGVRFVVVGGAAMRFYGQDRMRKDLDILVEPDEENAERLRQAMSSKGFSLDQRQVERLAKEKLQWPLPIPFPDCEILTSIGGVSFANAFNDSVETNVDGYAVRILSRSHLAKSKSIRRSEVDLKDLDFLRKS